MRSFAWLPFVFNTMLWGLYFAVAKDLLARLDPFVFGFLELGATVPVALVLLIRYRHHLTRRLVGQAAMLGLLFSLNTALLVLALLTTTATNTAFFPATGGILAASLATLLGRVITRRTWMAGLLALAGAGVLLVEGRGAGHGWGDVLAFGAAMAYMLYLFQADHLSHGAGPALWGVLGVELLTATAVLGLLAAGFGDWSGWATLSRTDAGFIAGVGWGASLVPAAIGLAFQKHVSPVTVAFIYALEPLMGALAGRWLLGEILSPAGLIGGLLILAGALLNAWPEPMAILKAAK